MIYDFTAGSPHAVLHRDPVSRERRFPVIGRFGVGRMWARRLAYGSPPFRRGAATWQELLVIVFGSWRHWGLVLLDICWLARWRSLAPALFARRGQCRDLPDELRP